MQVEFARFSESVDVVGGTGTRGVKHATVGVDGVERMTVEGGLLVINGRVTVAVPMGNVTSMRVTKLPTPAVRRDMDSQWDVEYAPAKPSQPAPKRKRRKKG